MWHNPCTNSLVPILTQQENGHKKAKSFKRKKTVLLQQNASSNYFNLAARTVAVDTGKDTDTMQCHQHENF